jgi:hypothetical protein
MMGIRSSVRNLLQNYFDQQGGVKDIARFLAEGVRRRCSLHCATLEKDGKCSITVRSPFGPMPLKLKTLGFSSSLYSTEELPKISEYRTVAPDFTYDVRNQGFIDGKLRKI